MTKSQINKNISLTIHSLGNSGEGIGDWHGYTVYVEGALPGEIIEAQLTEQHHSYGRARLNVIVTPSPSRVEPICPLFHECGGCQIMHLNYSDQLHFKQQQVVKALEKIGKITHIEVPACIPSPSSLGYRNKIQLPVQSEGSECRIGLYARNSHEIIDVDNCAVHCELGETIYKKVTFSI